jgi:TRAP-type C4-dicarboxylate transport system permease large subunit
MLAVAGLGSVMRSTGVVAIFVPLALDVAERLGMIPGRLIMDMTGFFSESLLAPPSGNVYPVGCIASSCLTRQTYAANWSCSACRRAVIQPFFAVVRS